VNSNQMDKFCNIDVEHMNKENLVDVENIKIDESDTQAKRFTDIIHQIKNPYCFKSGGIVVKVRYASTEKTISQSIMNYFSCLK